MKYTSIVMTCYRKGRYGRDEIFKKSIQSLLENTTGEYELILIDNTQQNKGLGAARNLGASMAKGDYLVITDDDIEFKKGWLDECVNMIELGDKFMATPVHQPRIAKWELDPFQGYRQNYRTGSNCMVMRRSAFDEIGLFNNKSVPTDGMNYADRISRAGYTFLITKEPLAVDMAFNVHSYIDNDYKLEGL